MIWSNATNWEAIKERFLLALKYIRPQIPKTKHINFSNSKIQNNCINPVQEMLLINTVALAYSKLKRHKDAVHYFKKQLKIAGEISKYLSGDNPPLCCSSIHRHWTPSPHKEYDLLCCYKVWWNDTFFTLIDYFEF